MKKGKKSKINFKHLFKKIIASFKEINAKANLINLLLAVKISGSRITYAEIIRTTGLSREQIDITIKEYNQDKKPNAKKSESQPKAPAEKVLKKPDITDEQDKKIEEFLALKAGKNEQATIDEIAEFAGVKPNMAYRAILLSESKKVNWNKVKSL